MLDLVKDQLVILYETDSAGDVMYYYGAVAEVYDKLYIVHKEGGGISSYRKERKLAPVIPLTISGQAVLVRKSIFGKYKFPKN